MKFIEPFTSSENINNELYHKILKNYSRESLQPETIIRVELPKVILDQIDNDQDFAYFLRALRNFIIELKTNVYLLVQYVERYPENAVELSSQNDLTIIIKWIGWVDYYIQKINELLDRKNLDVPYWNKTLVDRIKKDLKELEDAHTLYANAIGSIYRTPLNVIFQFENDPIRQNRLRDSLYNLINSSNVRYESEIDNFKNFIDIVNNSITRKGGRYILSHPTNY
jgi:hypothetical protein